MPKRDTQQARPHDHLLAAAATHARLTAGDPHPDEGGAAEEPDAKARQKSERVKAQPRRDGGKFA